MWRTMLSVSKIQICLVTCFYVTLLMMLLTQFYMTPFDCFSSVVALLLVADWIRSVYYFLLVRGEFVLFHKLNQIYWHHQRWYLVCRPLLLRYAVIISLKSRRNGKKQTLFLMSDTVKKEDWRALHYYFRQHYYH